MSKENAPDFWPLLDIDISKTTTNIAIMTIQDLTPSPSTNDNSDSESATLFTLPAEIRNKIYASATSHHPKKIGCQVFPALALVSRQLHAEVPPIFYESNTFHLTSALPLKHWRPITKPSTLNTVHIDLASSAAFGWTLRSCDLLPFNFLYGEDDGEDGEVVVAWTSRARGMALWEAEPGRPSRKVFLEVSEVLRMAEGKGFSRKRTKSDPRDW